jgi:hypothetical protein
MVKCAIIGVERQELSFSDCGEDALGRLLRRIDTTDRERALLVSAALAAPYRRAGLRAIALEPTMLAEAPQEHQPLAPPECVSDLLMMMAGEYREALSEWLESAGNSGWRVPEEHLADLLDYGRGQSAFREVIAPLLGRRGRWLAAQNPDWSYALKPSASMSGTISRTLPGDSEVLQIWETGAPDERVQLVTLLRQSEPDRARNMIESTWSTEPHEMRAAFLDAMRNGLTIADEPMLEAALDDKRKEVREAAQRLLPRLPDSTYSKRMWERCRPLVRIETSFLRAYSLAITLPTECDKSMIRDGIESKPPRGGMGQGAWLLYQIVSRTPLRRWTEELNRTPEQLISMSGRRDAAGSQEWKPILVNAWTAALEHSGDRVWATPLFHYWVENTDDGSSKGIVWSGLVPREELESGVERLFDRLGPVRILGSDASELLLDGLRPWSLAFARRMLAVAAKIVETDPYTVSYAFWIADRIPPELQPELEALMARIGESHRYAKNQVNEYLALNHFRKEMRRKFAAAMET